MPLHATYLLNVFLLSIILILVLERLAPRVGLIDLPSVRKSHGRPVPVVGGVAMFFALLVVDLMLEPGQRLPWDLVAGLTLLVTTGVIDDRYSLPANVKLMAQIAAACILTLPQGTVVSSLGDLLGTGNISLGGLELPFTLVLIVGLVNAYNMFDGLDGLAGGASAAAMFWLAAMALSIGHQSVAVGALLFLFATFGFLVFNLRHPWSAQARVFMGDAGSMMFGAGVAILVVQLSRGPGGAIPLADLLWVCALPAMDTLSLIVRRLHAGQSPLAADRNHLHHLLLDSRMSSRQVTDLLIAVCFVLGGIGFAGAAFGVPDAVMALGLAVLLALHVAFVCFKRRPQSKRSSVADAPQPIGGGKLNA